MMQASHFPPQPGMQMPQGHMMGGPGPGHPMQQGMQMHPGVSGPNGPVSQAGPMMAGMQPGVGPNAHALQHLQPQQAHMFQQQQQQQQQQMQMNPALMQQQRAAQQQAMLQQQHQRQMLAQQAQQNGMGGMNFQAHQMAGMTPQQIAQLQGNIQQQYGIQNMPPHLRQQLAQQQMHAQQQQQQQASNPQAAAMAQAQAQQQAQAAAHAHAQQAQQQQQQQHQQMQQQQAIAMQHAQSQQSNHSNPGSQGPPTTSQPPQAPLRPPSAMSHQGQASPAPQPTPQQQPQQLPQSTSQPPQQSPAPNQPPGMPQQNQQPQNQQQMPQRNPGMGQPPSQQQVALQVHAQAAQAQARAQAAQQMAMQGGQQRSAASSGQQTLKLMLFVNDIGKFNSSREPNRIEIWQSFVDKFFAENGSFVHVLFSEATAKTKQFDIVHASLPRYFFTQFNTEVEHLQITLDGATEKNDPSRSETKVTCDRAKFIYTYKNQCQVICSGRLTAFWATPEKMETLQFETQSHQQVIPKALLESLFEPPQINPHNAQQSPRMGKNKQQKVQTQGGPSEPFMLSSKLPSAHVTDFALPPALQSYLEVYETMNNMASLIKHYNEHDNTTPAEAMLQWNNMMSSANPQMRMQPNPNMQQPNGPPGMQPGNMPPGSRTPQTLPNANLPPNQQFMSPAMANSLLPNGNMSSPHMMSHTPSPASHPMVHQVSQGGSSASQNTSPNMTSKRRRSTAKLDGDEGDGAKVKQSPRVGGGKRAKNNG